MARTLNLFSEDQQIFGDGLSPGFSGWGFLQDYDEGVDARASLRLLNGVGPTNRYIPTEEGAVGNSLACGRGVADSLSIVSPWVSCDSSVLYKAVVSGWSARDVSASISIEYRDVSGDEILLDDEAGGPNTITTSIDSETWRLLYTVSISPQHADSMRMLVSISRDGGRLSLDDFLVLYDPVLVVDNPGDGSVFGQDLYFGLPDYMVEDDAEASRVLGVFQPTVPLYRLIETLTYSMGRVSEELVEIAGTPSSLADPQMSKEKYKDWLLSLVGGDVVYAAALESTSWSNIEQLNLDEDLVAGEWEDIELLNSWQDLESVNVTEVDLTEDKTKHIETGASGIHAGKFSSIRNIIDQYAAGLIQNSMVSVQGDYKGVKNIVRVFIPQDVVDEISLNFFVRLVNVTLPAGAAGVVVSNLAETADSYWFYDDSAVDFNFISSTPKSIDDLGGGGRWGKFDDEGAHIGTARHALGLSYFNDGETGALSNDNSPSFLGVKDVVVGLSDVAEISAGPVGSGLSEWFGLERWRFRERRLIVVGGNDVQSWGVYLVSGTSPDVDDHTRVLYVKINQSSNSIEYVLSDPVDVRGMNSLGVWFVRVTEDSDGNVGIFIEKDLYGITESNKIGEGTVSNNVVFSFVSHSVAVGYARIPHSSDDRVLPAGNIHRLLMFDQVVERPVESSDDGVAVVGGVLTSTRDFVDAEPALDLNLTGEESWDGSDIVESAGGRVMSWNNSADESSVVRMRGAPVERDVFLYWPDLFGVSRFFWITGTAFGDVVTFHYWQNGQREYTETSNGDSTIVSVRDISGSPYVVDRVEVTRGSISVTAFVDDVDVNGRVFVSEGSLSVILQTQFATHGGLVNRNFVGLSESASLPARDVPTFSTISEFSVVASAAVVYSNTSSDKTVFELSGENNVRLKLFFSDDGWELEYRNGSVVENMMVSSDDFVWESLAIRYSVAEGLRFDVGETNFQRDIGPLPEFSSGVIGDNACFFEYLGWFDRSLSDAEVGEIFRSFG